LSKISTPYLPKSTPNASAGIGRPPSCNDSAPCGRHHVLW
jgi:hypothetical protein